jgi:hypothetical protein
MLPIVPRKPCNMCMELQAILLYSYIIAAQLDLAIPSLIIIASSCKLFIIDSVNKHK